MKNHFLLPLLFPLIYLLGFLSGSCWQTLMFRGVLQWTPPNATIQERQSESVASGLQHQSRQQNGAETLKPAPARPITEQSLEAALEDPDFKRVHDFLTRENPMQMNLDPPNDAKP